MTPLHWKKRSAERKKLKMLENKGLADSTKTGGGAEGAVGVQPGSVLSEWKKG